MISRRKEKSEAVCKCGSKHIVNKKYQLCDACNYVRIHGKSRYEVGREKAQKNTKPKKVYRIKTKINHIKIDAYAKFDKQMEREDKVFCSGCGTYFNLSHSHLVPVSFNKRLEGDLNNLKYHCVSMGEKVGCHDKWESRDIKLMQELNDFEESMERVKVLDPKYYLVIKERLDAR